MAESVLSGQKTSVKRFIVQASAFTVFKTCRNKRAVAVNFVRINKIPQRLS
jgi:hypothetical protein